MIFKIILVFIYFSYVFGNEFEASEGPVVETSSGLVKGLTINVLNKRIDQFLGIPYAEPPIGNLRFSKPIPIFKPIEGVIDATKVKNSCMQLIDPSNIITGVSNISEDCLVLNVLTPKSEKKQELKPVMFWIYGGGLSSGSIFEPIYDGKVLATQDIVFVSVNYRLGPFGFLYGGDESAPGNVGFFDQLLGLKWVRENIHLFGGDKNHITIFGESAGGWSVSAHVLSPLSKGLFKRAIMQSGAHIYNSDRPPIGREEGIFKAKNLAKQVNCADDDQWLECLRQVDANQLLPKPFELTFPVDGTEFLPMVAKEAFNRLEFNKDLDLMVGVTKDEGSLFPMIFLGKPHITATKDVLKGLIGETDHIFHNLNVEKITNFYLNNVNTSDSNAIQKKIWDFLGDIIVKCPVYHFTKRYAEQSTPETNVYFYELNHILKELIPGSDFGVYHGADLFFMFGLPLLEPNTTSEENIRFTKDMVIIWTDFAKYGKPDNDWPKFIDIESHSSVPQIRDLNPSNSHKYKNSLSDNNCETFWKNYFK